MQWHHTTIEEVLQVTFFVGLLRGYMTQLTRFSSVRDNFTFYQPSTCVIPKRQYTIKVIPKYSQM
jgi:hypothetical protein